MEKNEFLEPFVKKSYDMMVTDFMQRNEGLDDIFGKAIIVNC